jgi:C4-dicarboxylate-specific signal transduction histidine kinase
LELYLTGLALVVALVIPLALELGSDEQELAAAALAAVVAQGVIFWLLRRRYRRVRQEVIEELRDMLRDRINNHLTVLLMSVTDRRNRAMTEDERQMLETAIEATQAVSQTLAELSTESLRRWKAHYSEPPDPPDVTAVPTRPIREAAGSRIRR